MSDFWIEFFVLSGLAVAFGLCSKIADAIADDGLKLFPGDELLFGALAGAAAYFSSIRSDVSQAIYVGLLFYWLWKKKADCRGHALAAMGIILSAFHPGLDQADLSVDIVGIFAAHVLMDSIKHQTKSVECLQYLFSRHVHFHLIGVGYALILSSVLGYSIIFFNMLGTYFVYGWQARRQ